MSCIVYQYIYMYMFSSMRQSKHGRLCILSTLTPDHQPMVGHGRICLNQSVSPFEIIRKHVLRDEVIPRTPENHTGISSLASFFVQEGMMVSTVHEQKSNPHKLNLPLFTKVFMTSIRKVYNGTFPPASSSSQDCDGCSFGPHNPTMILVVTGWMGDIFWNPHISKILRHLPASSGTLEGKMEASVLHACGEWQRWPQLDEGRPYFF